MTKPWHTIESVDTDEGILELRQRGEKDFLITIAGRVLMNSFANISEIALSKLACDLIKQKKGPSLLLGGLGMGYTLRAALDNLPKDARVVVAELNPVVVKWCRGPIAHLTEGAIDDPRVTVEISDVASLVRKAAKENGVTRYDAIILDLYEGPFEAAKERGEYLYGDAALKMSNAALISGGIFAVWSEDPDRAFEKRLRNAGFSFECNRPRRSGHVIYLAKKQG